MSEYKKIYFLGIGGIGMSAIARYYKFKGYPVAGYDRTPSDLTHELEKEGIDVHYEDDIDFIPKDVESTLVVYTPAIPETLGEFVYVKEHNYTLIKRSRMLGELSQGQTCLAVAGTHGKTTTSTMVAHILNTGHNGCSAFLGGISKNYGTNLLMSQTPTLVAEADEFDRSFLQLSPAIAVITAMDADHLDIYGTHEEYCKAFRQFAAKVTGKLVIKKGLPVGEADTGARIFSYSYDDTSADFHAENITKDELGHYTFDLVHPKGRICGIRTGVPGWVNVENSIAAGAVCLLHGVSPEGIRKGIGTFQGVRRRLDVHINEPGLTYIDDYAHHPKELASAISSIKNMFPGRKLTAIFQPHLYSRTRDFASQFAEALSHADEVILLDIYPAREQPIEGVTSEIIFKDIKCKSKALCTKKSLVETIENYNFDVLLTVGAGDICNYLPEICEIVKSQR